MVRIGLVVDIGALQEKTSEGLWATLVGPSNPVQALDLTA